MIWQNVFILEGTRVPLSFTNEVVNFKHTPIGCFSFSESLTKITKSKKFSAL